MMTTRMKRRGVRLAIMSVNDLHILLLINVLIITMKNSNSCCLKVGAALMASDEEGAIISRGSVREVKVGVVIKDNNNGIQGKKRLSCIKMALSDFYENHPNLTTKLVLHVREYSQGPLLAASAALDLVKNVQVAAILGPDTSGETEFVINIGDRAHVPIVSYSATSAFLSPSQNPYFVRATLKDSTQVQPLCDLIQHFKWKEVVPVYPDHNPLFVSDRFVASLVDSLQQIGVRVPYKSVIPLSSNDDQIEVELNKMAKMQIRVFLVHMPDSLGSRLFLKAAKLGMMSQNYVWIVTTPMSDAFSLLDPQVIQSMQGVLGIQTYFPPTRELEKFTTQWKTKFQQDNPKVLNPQITVDELRVYDATTALARAVEQVGFSTISNTSASTNVSYHKADNLTTDLSTFGVSPTGPQLLEAIRSVRFKGMSGDFSLPHGELQLSAFRVINVVGDGKKEICYWTPSKGFVNQLNTSKSNLGVIIWPGDHTLTPKGWVPSPIGTNLRIGVPIKKGFREFVNITRNPITNKTHVTGYCIDVFDAMMAKLHYSVPYEYIPYPNDDSDQPTDSYDDLINQIHLKNYDAVVGDTTIRWNRTEFAEFTLPYTESGVVMIAPMRDGRINKGAWLFVKPLTLDLWVTTFCFFIFIAFVIWVLEHRINEDFRGPPMHQVGTSLYYSFSTMVFSHSFSVFNNSTRFVVIIWVFVLLILTQSYTANLASLLTVEQLQPTITDIKELLARGDNVGYQEGSFVKGLLKSKSFSNSQLKSYESIEQLDELLTKGTANGGIAAAFDEIPYMKLFLDRYCSKYTMTAPTYKTDGFGFVFPRGFPLLSDVSRALLNVTEGDEMTAIEKKWFNQRNSCLNSTSPHSSTSLSLDSFRGLFTIVGASALFVLVISFISFLNEHRNVWSNNSASVWTRIRSMLRMYDQKNLRSHTFRKSHPRELSPVVTPSSTPNRQSPSSYWLTPERGDNSREDHSTASPEIEVMETNVGRLGNQEGDADRQDLGS